MDRTEIIARQCELENRILHGQINAQQVEHEIAGIEAKYGKDAFNPCKVTPKEKPWTEKTLRNWTNCSSSARSPRSVCAIWLRSAMRYIVPNG